MAYRSKNKIIYLLLLIGVILMVLPFIWMILTSFKPQDEVLEMPVRLLPSKIVIKNYSEVLTDVPFTTYFFNSVLVTIAVTFFQLITSALAGYAFARFSFKGKNILFLAFLGTMMIPIEVTLVPNYILMSKLGWIDTYFALIIPWGASVFGIFLMRQFFMTLPKELFEQAQIDGCSHWQVLWNIVFPISKPVFISVGLFSFIGSWNAFLWPLIMTNSQNMRTLPVWLSYFNLEFATRYHLMMAAAVLATLPVIIIYFFAQRYFVEGISTTGLK